VNAVLNQESEMLAQAGVEPLISVLRQLGDLLYATSDDQYTMKPVGVVNSSIGGHVRHCLDHVDALLAGTCIGEMSYDDRQRGTDVETSRMAALHSIERQEQELQDILHLSVDQPIRLKVLMAVTGPSILVETSLGRELAFVMSHTVHHNALIGVIAKILGIDVAERFGYAPSTLAHMESTRCAR
jgi:uncharacterized damage-inducible protein DinB